MNWFILLPPLASALLIYFFARPYPRVAASLSIGACATSFVATLLFVLRPDLLPLSSWVWADLPGFKVTIGAMGDRLAQMMLLVVTGVGLGIHVFSVGYMKGDAGFSRFFAKLSLFMFSMLGIVLADNLVMMFIFWELVGLSSYLLIGFWFQRPAAAEAAKKAFVVNRVGDVGFLLGILGVWSIWQSLDFGYLSEAVPVMGYSLASEQLINWVAFGLFMGCMGKSAMVPLHVWLPDAMEGPTPVSALIHAATMVAAGVYMLCRIFFILELAPVTLGIIAWVGAVTALMAALIATQQNDIKRVLAYSTLSQLGYMVAAVGLGATVAAMFHLSTHAFFKALLFLAAGSVIHALHHQQDMWKMGGLRKRMPVTSWTFFIGTAALAGVPLFSGFFSKEAILLSAYQKNLPIFIVTGLTAALTAYYMTRLVVVAFLGRERSDQALEASESPKVMTLPLILLALLSVFGGGLGIKSFLSADANSNHEGHYLVMGISVALLIMGVLAGAGLYWKSEKEPVSIKLLAGKFYFDEIYRQFLVRGQQSWARLLDWIDRWIIGGVLVRGISALGSLGGEVLRLVQAGNLHAYVFFFVLGILVLSCWMIFGSWAG